MGLGQVGAGLAIGAALVAGAITWLCPQPFPDRLAVIPEDAARIDNLQPYSVVENWAPGGLQAGLHVMNPWRVGFFNESLRALLRPPFRMLDAGCGGGLVSNALGSMPDFSIEGVDLVPQGLQYARTTAQKAGLTTVRFQNGSVYALPFEDASFDAVVMSDVLEHLHDLPRAVSEVVRVLRPGGLFLFDTIDRSLNSWFVAIVGAEYIAGVVPMHTHDWRLFIKPGELQEVLRRGGLGSFHVQDFAPAPEVLLGLVLFKLGLLDASALEGRRWHIGPANDNMVSYIGYAMKPAEA